jgi:hypothetical protein
MSLSSEDIAVMRASLQRMIRILDQHHVEPMGREQKIVRYREELIGTKKAK